MQSGGNQWDTDKRLAKALLRDSPWRRKTLTRLVLANLTAIVLGLLVIDHWLAASMAGFVLWWGAVALATVFMLMLALYDALAIAATAKRGDE